MASASWNLTQDQGQDVVQLLAYDPHSGTRTSASIYLYGAHLTSWLDSSSQHPLLFLSDEAVLDGSKPIRGGVPLCFPQFSKTMNMPMGHGFARRSTFRVNNELSDSKSAIEGKSSVSVVLELGSSEATKKHWAADFTLRLKVTLSATGPQSTLDAALTVVNTSEHSAPLSFTTALHTYFTVSDIRKVGVTGLSGLQFIDKTQDGKLIVQEAKLKTVSQEVDTVYYAVPNTLSIVDPAYAREITLTTNRELPDAVVWNPWISKAKSMGDFGDAEYNTMLCVESCRIQHPVVLTPQSQWTGQVTLSWKPLSTQQVSPKL